MIGRVLRPSTGTKRYVNTIVMNTLKHRIEIGDPDLCVIDVRSREELDETGRIDTSFHLPLERVLNGALGMSADDFEDEFGFIKPSKVCDVVFVCAAGVRSRIAAEVAVNGHGYTSVYNYKGGANEWFSEGPK